MNSNTIHVQTAIEALERILNFCEEIDAHLPEEEKSGYHMLPDYMIVRNCLMQLSPIEPKKGKWIDHIMDCWCSECGGRVQKERVKMLLICPYCGMMMERGEDEHTD